MMISMNKPPAKPSTQAPPTGPVKDPKSGAVHPGKVEYVNADDGTSKFEDARNVPPPIAFIGGVPVTKIVSRALPDGGREAVSFDADGKALRAQTFIKRKTP